MENIKPINYAKEHHEIKPSLFRESENMDRLLQAIFDVCDEQQNKLLWLAENILNLDLATGYHLDFIGGLVGQVRFLSDFNTEPYFGYEGSYQSKTFGSATDPEVGGYWNSRSYFNTATSRKLTDNEYRRLIKARVIFNQSNCTSNDLLEVLNLITDSNNNTVQLLKHGLIQINTSDTTGMLSYFVDRLYLADNILPIAAGVRVGLEQIVGSGGGDTGGGDTPPVGNDSGMVFSTKNYAVNENKDYPIFISAEGVSGDWSLTSNGVPLADYTGYASSEVWLNISPDGQYVDIELLGSSSGSRRYGLLIDADKVFFETTDYNEPTGIAKGEFVLYDWSNSIRHYYLRMPDTVIEVPNYLPEQITTTSFMFENSNLFNGDISNWDMSRVTEATAMFRYAKTFNSDISNWQVGQVEQFFGMFDGALDFNQDLSNWDVRSAYYFSNGISTSSGLEWMFNDATSFNQDLSSWCVSNQLTAPINFDSGASNWSLPKPIWGTCPRGEG